MKCAETNWNHFKQQTAAAVSSITSFICRPLSNESATNAPKTAAEEMVASDRGSAVVQLDEYCQYFCMQNMEQECTVNVRHGCAHFVTFSEPRGSTGNHCLRVVSSTDRAFLSIRSRGQSRQKCSAAGAAVAVDARLCHQEPINPVHNFPIFCPQPLSRHNRNHHHHSNRWW